VLKLEEVVEFVEIVLWEEVVVEIVEIVD